jgi:hypothetical protein
VARQSEEHVVEARLLDSGAGDIEPVVAKCDEYVGGLIRIA